MTFIVFMAKEFKHCPIVLFIDRGEKGHIFHVLSKMARTLSTPWFNCLTKLSLVIDV